ncbi:MAG: hypothetical protein ABI833_15385 [Acidobacteriota bacterium]
MMPISPAALKAEHFATYPPEARLLATNHIPLLKELPLAFLPLLLREMIEYDWKFPAERRDLKRQLSYLESLPSDGRRRMLAGFSELKLSSALERIDWVSAPVRFSEQLTAFLWTSHQIDDFRSAAVAYIQKLDSAMSDDSIPIPRLGIVLVGHGVTENQYPLFRKLRPHGVYFKQVDPQNGLQAVLEAVARRASEHPAPFAHWYIDGGSGESLPSGELTRVSYHSLAPVRAALLDRIRKIAQSRTMGPEGVVTALAQMRPDELGLGDSILNRFQVDLLTQGSGTQVFSTTFVQWAAREALRRAQPITLFARFAARQRERPMNELLAGTYPNDGLDPQGALIDADMGGYYTWLNQQRLSDFEKASFLIWFEDHNEAVGIGPGLAAGAESNERLGLAQILNRIV